MSWNKISSYLDRFRAINTPQKTIKEIVVGVIAKSSGVVLETSDVDVKNQRVFLKITPILKNEIFLNRDRILETLRNIPETKEITTLT